MKFDFIKAVENLKYAVKGILFAPRGLTLAFCYADAANALNAIDRATCPKAKLAPMVARVQTCHEEIIAFEGPLARKTLSHDIDSINQLIRLRPDLGLNPLL